MSKARDLTIALKEGVITKGEVIPLSSLSAAGAEDGQIIKLAEGVWSSGTEGSGSSLNSDPYFNNVVFLANWSNGFVDIKGHTITARGSPTINNDIPFYGTPSVKMNGSSPAAITVPAHSDFHFNGAWCVEGFIFQRVIGGVWINFDGSINFNWQSQNVYFEAGASSSIHWVATATSSGPDTVIPDTPSATGMLYTNFWHHAAFTCEVIDGIRIYRLFLDGKIVRLTTSPNKPYDIVHGVGWGSYFNGGWNNGDYAVINGALGPQRITNGIARYTTNFEPPTMFPTSL